jgi:hypothetical protein
MNFVLKNKYKIKKTLVVAIFFVGAFFAINLVKAQTTFPTSSSTATFSTSSSTAGQTLGGSDAGSTTTKLSGTSGGFFLGVFKTLIFAIMVFFSWLLNAASVLFTFVVDVKNVDFFMNNDAVKAIWYTVRDFLNMFFILVLLFASFCTIFQYSKWNLKSIWLSVLINALLVNFSFAIARFLIDISNVIMYYMLNNYFGALTNNGAGGIFASITGQTGIVKLLVPGPLSGYEVSYLIAATVFVFILAMTFLVMAVLFLIRLVSLTVIVMFAPVGFVGNIAPPLKKFADQWWSALFNNAFYGPAQVFFLMVAMKIMTEMSKRGLADMSKIAAGNTTNPDSGSFIASMAFFLIPVVILWIGMGVSKKFSIAGAGEVVGRAEKYSKQAGNWAKHLPGRGAKYGWQRSGGAGAAAQFKKDGKVFGTKVWLSGDKRKESEERNAALLSGGFEGRDKVEKNQIVNKNREDIKKQVEDHEHLDMDELDAGITGAVSDANMDKKGLIAAAAKLKQALSRGGKFDEHLEDKFKAEVESDPATRPAPTLVPPAIPAPIPLDPTRTYTQVELAEHTAARAEFTEAKKKSERDYREETVKWEKEVKDKVKKKKEEYMKEARKVISRAEEAKQ